MGYMRSAKYGSGSEEVVLVNDESGSMDTTMDGSAGSTRLEGAREASIALVGAKEKNCPRDRVGVVAYSTKARVIHSLVSCGKNKRALVQALNTLKAGGGTNITAGLAAAEKLLFGEQSINCDGAGPVEALFSFLFGEDTGPHATGNEGKSGPLRRIVLLTDGQHNRGPSPQKPAEKLKSRGVIIDCIGIGGSPDEVAEKQLKEIASRGADGQPRYWFIGEKGKLIRKYRELSKHIRPA